jgi:hypothetical protein
VGKGEDSARGGQGAEGRERWGRMEEEESSKMGQRAVFIDVESGGGPVHAPCPIRRAPNPGGPTPRPRL